MTPIPVRVAFRGLPHSDALETEIMARVAALERLGRAIEKCRVVLEMPHRHRHDGRHFHVRIELAMQGAAPVV